MADRQWAGDRVRTHMLINKLAASCGGMLVL